MMSVVLPDRSIVGTAVYDTVPGTGSVMSFVLPDDCSLLWATADFNPAVPLRSAIRDMVDRVRRPTSVPNRLDLENRHDRLQLDGFDGSIARRSHARGVGTTTTLVSVYTPPGLTLSQRRIGGLEAAGMARLEMARADWLARGLSDLIARFDRSSGRDHEKLVSLLINHEMALRAAQRSVQWTERGRHQEKECGAAQHDLSRFCRRGPPRDELIGRAGLENDLTSADLSG